MKTVKRKLSLILALVMVLVLIPRNCVTAEAATAGDGTYTWPVSTSIGISNAYTTSHGGFDLGASIGSAVYAVADGTVIRATDNGCQGSHGTVNSGACPLGSSCGAVINTGKSHGSYANWIIIDHGGSVYSLYAHLKTDTFTVSVGDTVRQGQQIASSGNAGNTHGNTGAHLHFELRMGGNSQSYSVNPSSYLTKSNVTPAPSYVDVGSNFYAYIINTDSWKHLTNDQPNVSIRSETGVPAQVWYFERLSDGSYKITSVLDGNCLDVHNYGTADGTNVQTCDSNDSTAQQWFILGSSGQYYFKAKCADTVMDVNGGSHDDGTNVQMWTKNGTAAQLFQIWKLEDYMPPVNIGTDRTALILHKTAWIPIANCYTEGEKPTVRLAKENGYANQLWRFMRQSDGSYKIASCYDGKFLDVRDASTEACAVVQTCVDSGSDAQKWYIIEYNGGYVLKSKLSSYVLDLVNDDRSIGNHLQTYGFNGSNAQIWAIYGAEEVQLSGPTLTVNIGDSATNTKFTWNDVYGESKYDVKIWPGTAWEGDAYHIQWGATSGYELVLPAGTYQAYVDASNYFDCKMSNLVTFTVDEKTYTIDFDANGGAGAPAAQTKAHSASLTLNSTVPTREGYTFLGWATKADAAEAAYQPGSAYTENGNVTLYAVWGHEHVYNAAVTAPSCIEEGYTTYTCSVCGDSYTDDEVPATGVHQDDNNDNVCDSCGTDLDPVIEYQYGDANGDGSVNLKDVTALRRLLSQGSVDPDQVSGNPDANGDGAVNMKDITVLRRYLAGGWDVELPQLPGSTSSQPLHTDLEGYEVITTQTSANNLTCTSFRFGTSVQERDLVCWSLQQGDFSRTVLLNFAIHGWEDSYAADGQLLVDLGDALVDYYSKTADLKDCRLLIVPCANPDGIAEGTTNNGFGRCNADGIDLNRDFDASHVVYTSARNYTPAPFSGAESRALRDLVLAAEPDVVVDFHGWLNYTIGNSDLAEVFSTCIDLCHKYELGTGAHGYFSYWAQLQGAEAILVEFKDTSSIVYDDVILAVDKLIANNYGDHQTDHALDAEYAQFSSIVTYAITDDRVYTQKAVGNTGTDFGYIDGAADECTILQIYDNAWCKVRYPVGELFKVGYCELSAFIDPELAVEHYTANVSANTKVYTTATLATQTGSVWTTDTFTVVAQSGDVAQIIYPLDDGGYKMGWIPSSSLQ